MPSSRAGLAHLRSRHYRNLGDTARTVQVQKRGRSAGHKGLPVPPGLPSASADLRMGWTTTSAMSHRFSQRLEAGDPTARLSLRGPATLGGRPRAPAGYRSGADLYPAIGLPPSVGPWASLAQAAADRTSKLGSWASAFCPSAEVPDITRVAVQVRLDEIGYGGRDLSLLRP